jgi:hypothetical protein
MWKREASLFQKNILFFHALLRNLGAETNGKDAIGWQLRFYRY